MNWRDFYFSPKGRIGRKDFLIKFMLPYIVLFLPINIIFDEDGVVFKIFLLLTLWPLAVVHIKRFHDFGQSAWIALLGYPVFLNIIIFGLVMFLLQFENNWASYDFFAIERDYSYVAAFFDILPVVVIAVLMLLSLTIPGWIPGSPEENKYGLALGHREVIEEKK